MTVFSFNFKGEDYVTTQIVGDDIYAKRPGRRGRPSRFTKQRLEAAGAVLVPVVDEVKPVVEVQEELPLEETNVVNDLAEKPVQELAW